MTLYSLLTAPFNWLKSPVMHGTARFSFRGIECGDRNGANEDHEAGLRFLLKMIRDCLQPIEGFIVSPGEDAALEGCLPQSTSNSTVAHLHVSATEPVK